MGRALIGCLFWVMGCGAPDTETRPHGPLELVLLHTADTHSELFPWRTLLGAADARRGLGQTGELAEVGGLARLATLVRRERRGAPRVLHLDSGDVFQGSLAFERFRGEPELLALDALGVDAQALGNHELDLGAALVEERYRTLGRFPLLAANYAVDAGGGIAGLGQPFVVLAAGGLRVGVIGLGNTSSVGLLDERPSELGVLATDSAEAVQRALDTLRPVVDVVVALTHVGLDADHALVRATSGLDVVLGGHQHLTLDEPDWEQDCAGSGQGTVTDGFGGERRCSSRPVPIVHSGAYGKFLGRLALTLDDEPARLGATYDPLDGFEVTSADFRILPVRADTPSDPDVSTLLEPYRAISSDPLTEVLAYAPAPLERYGATGGDSPLGNLAAAAVQRAAAAELAVIGASSLRHDLPPGLLDREGVVRVAPFEDPIVRAELTGRALAAAFEAAARSASGRDCRTQIQVAGALLRFRCPCSGDGCARGFASATDVPCQRDADCASFEGACGAAGLCLLPLEPGAIYGVATTAYLAGGGSGLFEPIPASARTAERGTLNEALVELVREARGQAASEGTDDGCADEAVTRAGTPARAEAACDHLPRLDPRLGAVRDGRIRFEVP